MQVTKIEELSKSRCKVYLDQELAFILYKGELRSLQVKEGQPFSEESYRTIMEEVLPKRAKLRCMNLLMSREYTVQQLKDKLRQGFYPEEIIEKAAEYVASFHYIDDLRYAEDYITAHEDKRSRKRIEQDLLGKGISREILEQAWQQWEEKGGKINEATMIQKLLEKKRFDGETADWKEKQKMYAYLMRKGFSASEISKVISNTN